MSTRPRVRLTGAFGAGQSPSHPWVYARNVVKPTERIPPGTVVDIEGADGAWVARGFYNARARVTLRILTTDPEVEIDETFLAKRLDEAISWRREKLALGEVTNAMRLVHSEGDGLSGLVIDLYDEVLAIEYFAAGMFRLRDTIHRLLQERFPRARLYWFAEKRIQKQESFDCWEQEPPPPVIIEEHGLRFRVDVGSAHKTGFFPDQRDNRLRLASLCRDRRVLDLCTHTGGFAVYAAAKGRAREVYAVDLDPQALQVAAENAALNGVNVRYETADVYEWLRAARERGERYDVVVLDPAKQTRSREQVDAALDQYVAMNRLAMEIVTPGGILLTCSCSGLITEAQFLDAIRRAALHAGTRAQVFDLSGAAPDHPFLVNVPESRYLKAIWCRIQRR